MASTRPVSRRRVASILIAGLAAVTAVALGSARLGESTGAPSSPASVSSASYRWPVETLRDWTDFADQLSVIRIESERQLPRSRAVTETGEGMVGREVTARIVETLWRHPGSSVVEGVITFGTWGWTAKGERLTPMTDSSSGRLEVGDRVLAPLMLVDGSWAPLTPSSTIELVEGRTAFAPRQRRAFAELAGRLDGVSPRAVADALAAVEPRPDAAALRRLHPDERARRLAARS
jgi:hypothetical protein